MSQFRSNSVYIFIVCLVELEFELNIVDLEIVQTTLQYNHFMKIEKLKSTLMKITITTAMMNLTSNMKLYVTCTYDFIISQSHSLLNQIDLV